MFKYIVISYCLTYGLFTYKPGAVTSKFEVSVATNNRYPVIGDDVIISCRVRNSEGKNVRYTVIWHKLVDGKRIKGDIGTNWYVNDNPFGATGRYAADKDLSDTTFKDVTFFLNISNVQKNDTGKIGCNIAGTGVIMYEDLHVLSPVESITLYSTPSGNSNRDIYVDNSVIKFTGEALEMTCEVKNAYPQPVVRMLIGNKDITNEFEQTAIFRQEGTNEALKGITYDVVLKKKDFAVKFNYNNENLKCVASVPNSNFLEKSTQFQVQASNYQPTFLCDEKVIFATHDRDVNITCRIMADPPVTNTSFIWPEDSASFNRTIIQQGEEGHYKASTHAGESENEKIMILEIDHVFPQIFRKHYFFASSDLGESVHVVNVIQDPDSREVSRAGQSTHLSLSLIPTIALLTTFSL